jgi:hypothetical protein
MTTEYVISLPILHPKQQAVLDSRIKRKIIRAGRRFGKTYVAADIAVEAFLEGRRILYTAPTTEQTERFWFLVKDFMGDVLNAGHFYKNESAHLIERPDTVNRIRAKTAWNADTLRGDFADLLIFDEWQLTDENAWGLVGAPMLLDNNGDAIFIYTPPSLHSRSVSKAKDPQHAAKMFKRARLEEELARSENRPPRWQTFTGSSYDNPKISREALLDITNDMTHLAYRQEIMAEDIDEAPGALWTRKLIETCRVIKPPREYNHLVVAVDPSATATGDEAGIMVAARRDDDYYVLADHSLQGSPHQWATAVVTAYHSLQANVVVAEANNGGEMVSQVIHEVDPAVPVKLVNASRGKQTRAEPVAAIYEDGRAHHVGEFPYLEDEMCQWIPGDPSPNRMDALVWAMTELKAGVKLAGTFGRK